MNAIVNGMPQQEYAESRAYKAFRKHLDKVMRGQASKEEIDEWAEENATLREMADMVQRDVRPSNVHVSEVLTSISVMYANGDFIGDRIMPPIVGSTAGKLTAQYYKFDKRDRLAYPDDTLGEGDDPAELSQNRSLEPVALTIRSLRELVNQYTLQNQDQPLNELVDAQQNVAYGMKFRRELRVITEATTAGNFGSNTLAIAAGDRWDTSTGGDPGGVVDAAKAATWTGSGGGRWVAACSLPVYNVLKRHPKILDTFKYGAGSSGPKSATRQMLADYFDVDELLVGEARKDIANLGQTASYSRMWPDVFGIYRVSGSLNVRNAAFGYTLQDAPTQSDLTFSLEKSAKGVWQARSTHADKQQIVCADCAYLITTPIG